MINPKWGTLIAFSQNMSRVKLDIKNLQQDVRVHFKRSFKRDNKIFCCHCPLTKSTIGIFKTDVHGRSQDFALGGGGGRGERLDLSKFLQLNVLT